MYCSGGNRSSPPMDVRRFRDAMLKLICWSCRLLHDGPRLRSATGCSGCTWLELMSFVTTATRTTSREQKVVNPGASPRSTWPSLWIWSGVSPGRQGPSPGKAPTECYDWMMAGMAYVRAAEGEGLLPGASPIQKIRAGRL